MKSLRELIRRFFTAMRNSPSNAFRLLGILCFFEVNAHSQSNELRIVFPFSAPGDDAAIAVFHCASQTFFKVKSAAGEPTVDHRYVLPTSLVGDVIVFIDGNRLSAWYQRIELPLAEPSKIIFPNTLAIVQATLDEDVLAEVPDADRDNLEIALYRVTADGVDPFFLKTSALPYSERTLFVVVEAPHPGRYLLSVQHGATGKLYCLRPVQIDAQSIHSFASSDERRGLINNSAKITVKLGPNDKWHGLVGPCAFPHFRDPTRVVLVNSDGRPFENNAPQNQKTPKDSDKR